MDRPRYYILRGKLPVAVSLERWGEWFENADCRVAETHVGDVCISTVFLGLDHNRNPNGPPHIFESMIFGGEVDIDDLQVRYSTWEEAERGHADLVLRASPKE